MAQNSCILRVVLVSTRWSFKGVHKYPGSAPPYPGDQPMTKSPQTKQQLIQAINRMRNPKVVLLAEDTPFELSKALRLMKQKRLTVIVIDPT